MFDLRHFYPSNIVLAYTSIFISFISPSLFFCGCVYFLLFAFPRSPRAPSEITPTHPDPVDPGGCVCAISWGTLFP